MAIRVKYGPDGAIETVEADSVAELLEYQRETSRNGAKQSPRRNSRSRGREELSQSARRLVEVLLRSPDGMETTAAAQALGVGPRGVGGFVTGLTNWGRRQGLKKNQLIAKERRSNGRGHTVRRINLTAFFRKMIKEGQVPGMQLDI